MKDTVSKCVLVGLFAAGLHCRVHAADSASTEFAVGNETYLARVAAQWKWNRQWMRSSRWHISGYWDLSLAQWQGRRFQNHPERKQDLVCIGITPVFRLQKNNLRGLYGEAGIGFHHLNQLYDNNGHQLSTHFQFGDHLSIGYVFRNRLDASLKFQHFSNGSIKQPNDGVNFVMLRISYPID